VSFVGLEDWHQAVDDLVARQEQASKTFVAKGSAEIAKGLRAEINSTGKHKKGTPTPATPGGPPGRITGGLSKGVAKTKATKVRDGVYKARVTIGRAAFYGRILDKDGTRNGKRYPFFTAGVKRAMPRVRELHSQIYRQAFRK